MKCFFQFYDQQLPNNINTADGFNHWLCSQKNTDALQFTEQQLIRGDASTVKQTRYPDFWEHEGVRLPLRYHFEPGTNADGVTLTIPLPVLPQISVDICEWLVPGLLEEKNTRATA